MIRTLLLLVSLITAGCASGPLTDTGTFLPPLQYQALQGARLCCASYRTMSYEPLRYGGRADVLILPESPVYEFDGRRSFFAAFKLPAGAERVLTVTTYPVNMLLNRAGHVLIPAVQFLNERHEPIGVVQPSFEPRSKFPDGSWADGHVRVPNAAHYAILFEGANVASLAWRDRDQRSGYLVVRRGPTGKASLFVSEPPR